MIGTGTQADPYIPTTWAEFVTAVGTSGAYVECEADAEWDMNDIAPEGISGYINIKCAELQGNGATIKNLYCTYSGGFLQCTTANSKIYDINFLNFYIKGYFVYTSTTYYFYGCRFSGLSELNSTSYCIFYGYPPKFLVSPNTNKGCSFNIMAVSAALFDRGIFEDAHIKFKGKNLNLNSATSDFKLTNCLVEGEFERAYYVRASACIFNCTCNSIGSLTYPDFNNTLVSTDTVESYPSTAIAVTSEQLRDAEYLQSQGFPIGVD